MNKCSEINSCICSETQVRFSFVILLSVLGIAVFSLVLFYTAIKYVKNWLKQKMAIKKISKALARETEMKLANSVQGYQYAMQDPQITNWLDQLQEQRFGKEKKGFVFMIDTDGKVWAHGKAKHLTKGDATLQSIDNISQKDTPIADMIRVAKKGGGYVKFYWKNNRVMVSYISPISNTNLLLGTAIPAPVNQKIWERDNYRGFKYFGNRMPNK